MSNILYVYGTLRPGGAETVKIKGQMFDLGWFPGVVLGGTDEIVAEKIQIEDWDPVDRYEGYFPEDHEASLYIRRPYEDGFIYELNRRASPVKQVMSGDWLDYTAKERGKYGGRFSRSS